MLRALFRQFVDRQRSARPAAAQAAPLAGDRTPLERARELAARREFDVALALLDECLRQDPADVEARLAQAAVYRKRGDLALAMDAYRRALVLDPRRAETWLDLGVCHYRQGDTFWARVYFRYAGKLEPDNADVLNESGLVEIAVGNYELAEESLENAVNRNPDHPEAWNNLGLVIARRGDVATARRHFLRATFLKPEFYMAQCNLGLACRDLEQLDEAEAALRRAVAIDPQPSTAWLNLGMVLQDLGRLDEALDALQRAEDRAAEDPDLKAALSALWLRRGDAAAAQRAAEEGLQIDSGHADLRLALAHAQLAQGNFGDGWRNYEARLRSNASPQRRFAFPQWGGEDLAGKSVLVYREQGLGDEIMFASCLGELVRSGARCLVDCDPRLRPLLRRSFPDVEVVEDIDALELGHVTGGRTIDACLPIGSLPSIFRTSRAAFEPARAYLLADARKASRWRERLATLGPGRTIGIAWRGGLYKTGRALRSLALDELLPLFRLQGVHWINLQHRDEGAERERMEREHGVQLTTWNEALQDLDETAALVSELDLVVTVCSSIVHLAGALGRPVWTLTPAAPAWRYFLAGDSLPWYPAVRLFRQRASGDWPPVVDDIAAALRARQPAG